MSPSVCSLVTDIYVVLFLCFCFELVAWRSSNAFHLMTKLLLRRAGLVLGWVIACGLGFLKTCIFATLSSCKADDSCCS